jgi:hypothetical protein
MAHHPVNNQSLSTLVGALFVAFGIGASPNSFGISISYEVEDLADTVVGQDLRKYIYHVSDFDFQRNQGFTIYFDADDFSGLDVAPVPPNADWDIIVGEPAPLLGDEGIYDALSIVNAGELASLADPFELSFVWQGAGDPGAQRFELTEFAEDGTVLQLLDSGFTVPAGPVSTVPEGGSAVGLLGLALSGIVGLKRALQK